MVSKSKNPLRRNKLVRFLKYRIVHVDDSPGRIAFGAALGIFVAWTPAFGLHTLMIIAICMILRANKLVAIGCIWISNPFTIAPIYYSNYLIGEMVLGWFRPISEVSNAEVLTAFDRLIPRSGLAELFRYEYWQNFMRLLLWKGAELWTGAALMGFLLAVLAYFVTYRVTVDYRQKHPHRCFHTER